MANHSIHRSHCHRRIV